MTEADKARFIEACAIMGAVFWSIQLLPQIALNYRRGHTEGMHQAMMLLWALAGLPLGIHNILSHQHIALQVQAQILTALSLITWAQVMHYSHRWTARRSVSAVTGVMLLFGAVETAFVVGFRYGTSSGQAPHGFIVAMAVLSAVLLSLGVLRHYYDIYTERSVRGLSWGFIMLDAAGDLASLLAVVVRSPPDRLAAGIYASELTLWIGIMLAGIVFNVLHLPLQRSSSASNQDNVVADENEAASPATPTLNRRSTDSVHSAFSVIRPSSTSTPQTLLERLRRRGRRPSPTEHDSALQIGHVERR